MRFNTVRTPSELTDKEKKKEENSLMSLLKKMSKELAQVEELLK